MEFNEKLQQLRKQNNLTQEQLAEKLYVSRTAISKWESGKGYPNIESLKSLSKLFSVSIDDLLSGEELISLAETENRSNLKKLYSIIIGILDIMTVACIFLPLYRKSDSDYINSVNLLEFTQTTGLNLVIYWIVFITMIGLGIATLLFIRFNRDSWINLSIKFSLVLWGIAICVFAVAREPYVTTLLFLLYMIKIFTFIKQSKSI